MIGEADGRTVSLVTHTSTLGEHYIITKSRRRGSDNIKSRQWFLRNRSEVRRALTKPQKTSPGSYAGKRQAHSRARESSRPGTKNTA